MPKRVAIVILNWNGQKYLEQFLPFLVNCGYPAMDLVVADNASTDQSMEWLKSNYPAIRRIQLPVNYGFAKGYNEALKQVEAESKTFRYELGKRVRHQLRIIPELIFHLDESLDYIENIDNLLKSDPIVHPEDHDYGMDQYKD